MPKNKDLTNSSDCHSFVVKIKKRIADAQYVALKQVNKELIGLYRDIGKMIELRAGQIVLRHITT